MSARRIDSSSEIVCGKLGSGKTIYAVERILRHLGRGGSVYTNVDLLVEEPGGCREFLERYRRWQLQPGQLNFLEPEVIPEVFRVVPKGKPDFPVLVVIDGAHLYFRSRQFHRNSEEWCDWLTHIRKWCQQVMFIGPSPFLMDKDVMRMCQKIYSFRHMGKFKVAGVPWLLKNQILRVELDYDGRTELDRLFLMLDKRLFTCYRTESVEGGSLNAVDGKTDFRGEGEIRRKLTWRGVVLRIAAGLVVAGSLVGIGGCKRVRELEGRIESLQRQLASNRVAAATAFASGVHTGLVSSVEVEEDPEVVTGVVDLPSGFRVFTSRGLALGAGADLGGFVVRGVGRLGVLVADAAGVVYDVPVGLGVSSRVRVGRETL